MRRLVCALVGHHWDEYSAVRWYKYTGVIERWTPCVRCGARKDVQSQ